MSCIAYTKRGTKCKNKIKSNVNYCGIHKNKENKNKENTILNDKPDFYIDEYIQNYDEYKYQFDGNNDLNWVILSDNKWQNYYGHNNISYYDPQNKIFCSCRGCYGLTIGEIYQKQTRNYKNSHCIDCICKFCVCNIRRFNNQYDDNPLTYYWDRWCSCIICDKISNDKKYKGIPIIQIQCYSEKYIEYLLQYENNMYIKYKNNISQIIDIYISNIKGIINIIVSYLSLIEIDPIKVVDQVHNIKIR
jgi:hypothetical protein